MATRRPATAKGRAPTMPPLPVPRSRSALAKSNTSHKSNQTPTTEEHLPQLGASTSSTSVAPPLRIRPPSKQQQHDESELNIQVVIRCRRRSEREIQDNSPIIVSANGPRGQEVTIETAATNSTLGIVGLSPTRTYPFDMVFGPEADQAMIYHDVVSPMLDEVLMGYNCTLFAYGQTGTGKTYTMQGDLTPTPMGNPSGQAGMIPRVLFRLFHQLESSGADYSVKISFVELYNEELRDLLAPDLSAPIGSSQPMGLGSGTQKDNQGGLKLFDDAGKKGVFIQGLEEAGVKDVADALALLNKGSQRRQIAATKFNDHSSRSHSIFSITVHTKETSSIGDDLLKVGKLNLVDLAGSENIGRSGAENKRAREAGMINQSLLTLGRVINALVDRSAHVPYRESKLTRLLQDSLGGRTKTCIIATISPARSNMEETLSTLDYAIRAKSIRNKPEINQRMTRNALLKEYVGEIERLKADLLAAREKNGIFFSEDTWTQLSAEHELRLTEVEEAKKEVEIVESQMRNVREEFEQSIALLMKRDCELKETRKKLEDVEGALAETEGQFQLVKVALEEEVIIRQAHAMTELVLAGVAGGLKSVTKDSVADVGRLFEKLERKAAVCASNARAVSVHCKTITAEAQTIISQLEEFVKASDQLTTKLRAEAEQFQTRELDLFSHHSQLIDAQIIKFQEALQFIQTRDEISSEAIGALQSTFKHAQECIKQDFYAWSVGLWTRCDTFCKEVEQFGIQNCASVENSFNSLSSLLDSVVRETVNHVETERKVVLEVKSTTEVAANAEIARLQGQNALLTRLLQTEKVKSERARDDLIKRVSGLLSDFTEERDRGLQEAVSEVRKENTKAEGEMERFRDASGKGMDSIISEGHVWVKSVERRSGEGKRLRDGGLKALSGVNTTVKNGSEKVRTTVSDSLSAYSADIERQAGDLNATYTEVLDRVDRAKRARIESTEVMATDVQTSYGSLQGGITSTARNIEGTVGRIMSDSSGLHEILKTYRTAAMSHISSARQATRSLLEQGTRTEAPTGTTPRKRVWEYVDQWELTKERDVLLDAWRQRNMSSNRGNIVSSDSLSTADPQEDMNMAHVGNLELDTEEVEIPASATSQSPPQLASKNGPSGIPVIGTLTDRSTNVISGRMTRRVR